MFYLVIKIQHSPSSILDVEQFEHQTDGDLCLNPADIYPVLAVYGERSLSHASTHAKSF